MHNSVHLWKDNGFGKIVDVLCSIHLGMIVEALDEAYKWTLSGEVNADPPITLSSVHRITVQKYLHM